MGVDFSAHAMIGVYLDLARLYRVKRVRSCSHSLPDGAEYCPKCGKPAEQLVEEPIFDEDDQRLGGLLVVRPPEEDYAIVGTLHCETREYDKPAHVALPPDLTTTYELIERTLRQYELWDDQPIVLYSILDWS